MKYDNTLYIIGNGFDLYHGANSSYSNFKEFVKQRDYSLYITLNSFFMPHNLWSDFEANLALLDRSIPLMTAEAVMPNQKKDFDDLQIADIMLPGSFAGGTLDALLEDLRKIFHKWILTLKLPRSKMFPKLWINDYARFITFNYTNVLESVYGIERERIKYIHGRYTDKMGSLIIGHGTPSDETFNNWIDSIRPKYNRLYTNKKGKRYKRRDMLYNAYLNEDYYDPIIEMAVERIEDYFSDSFKDTDQIVLDNKQFFNQLYDVEYIYVLGHSISQVDARYFKEIILQNKDSSNTKWFVTYYSKEEKKGLLLNLQELGVKSSQIDLISWNKIER